MNDVEAIGEKILVEVRATAEKAWDAWSPDEKALVRACAMDAARLALKAAAGVDIAAEKRFLDASMSNIRVSMTLSLQEALWDTVARVLRIAAMAVLP